MYQAIVFVSALLICLAVLIPLRKREGHRRLILKGLTVAYFAVCFVHFLLSDAFIFVINDGWFYGVHYDATDYLGLVLRWGYYTSYVCLPMAVFCAGRLFRNIASYVSLPFSVAVTFFFENFMAYYLDPAGLGYHPPEWFRYGFFTLELVLAIAIPLILMIGEKHVFAVRSGREWANFLIGMPLVVLAMMPVYVPQAIFGCDVKTPPMFGGYHLTWIAVTLVITVALYLAFRFKDYTSRRNLVVFLALLLFFHYDSLYMMGVTISRLPFQLCNIAAYFYIVAVVFKLDKMFQFCFIINTVGTVFAILFPDLGVGSSGFWNVHFLFEHTLVLLVGAMGMGLRLVPRLKPVSLKYCFVGYTAYFLFVFILGTILNGYSDLTGETVNYFYMFDHDIAFDYFPFLTFTENYYFTFGRFIVYPLVVLILYFGFALLSFLYYLLVRYLYKLDDDHLALRLSSIELYERVTGRKALRPKHFTD
ncbi:MAG: YwaF family protein [Clostridia bacterium]|nr:YwaF family protein [Clostridia bacterium]